MLLVLDRYEEFAGVPVSICALPRELYVGGGDKWHEALTRLFQTDNVGRKWTSGCLGCCVLSAVPQIYFTFVGYKDYVKPISSWCPERTVCPYDCCFSFFWGGCFFVVVSLFLFFPVLPYRQIKTFLDCCKLSVRILISFLQDYIRHPYPPVSWSIGVTLF